MALFKLIDRNIIVLDEVFILINSKMDKWQRISWLGHLEGMEEDRMPKKDLHSRTGRDEKKGKIQ